LNEKLKTLLLDRLNMLYSEIFKMQVIGIFMKRTSGLRETILPSHHYILIGGKDSNFSRQRIFNAIQPIFLSPSVLGCNSWMEQGRERVDALEQIN
jgi:hypothetical protein